MDSVKGVLSGLGIEGSFIKLQNVIAEKILFLLVVWKQQKKNGQNL